MKVAVLAGGVGGAKLALGLYHTMDRAGLTIIANTGDDIAMHGLHVSPDPDIMIYTLAGLVNPQTGWGFAGESFRVAEGLKAYGRAVWFNLGDRDLATHIHRSALLKEGATLSAALDSVRRAHRVEARVLPMCDSYVPTHLDTDEGRMHLQDYFVRRACEPKLRGIVFENIAAASAAPGVLDAIAGAAGIVIAPSNPLISIGPILAVPGIREALVRRRDSVVAVCPLVGGKSLKGPSDKMMAELGHAVSAPGVAALYRDFCGTLVIDDSDEATKPAIEGLGMKVAVCPTVMRDIADKKRLARDVLRLVKGLRA